MGNIPVPIVRTALNGRPAHELEDEREERFAQMACDGLPLGIAYRKAGLDGEKEDWKGGQRMFQRPRIQQRMAQIMEARRRTGIVTLQQVTDMLARVYASALHAEDHSAAHNAAFSLARLYGLVIERSQVEVSRRPSRDPDAPAEVALSQWVAAIPGPAGPEGPAAGPAELGPFRALPPGPEISNGPSSLGSQAANGPSGFGSGPGPEAMNEGSNSGSLLEAMNEGPNSHSGLEALNINSFLENINKIKDLAGPGPGPGRSENGAPARPVTGTPNRGARTKPLKKHEKSTPKDETMKKLVSAEEARQIKKAAREQQKREARAAKAAARRAARQKGAPRKKKQVPVPAGGAAAGFSGGPEGAARAEYPKAEDLF